MRNFNLKTLLIVVALAAIAIATCLWGFDAYKQHSFRKSIEPAWAEAPVSSTPTPVEDGNSIVIYFADDDLAIAPSSSNAELQKIDLEREDSGYDLSCSFGNFRVVFDRNAYTELTSTISPESRPFDVIRDSLMLDNESPASTAPLWLVRAQFMPIGCNTRLQHFETHRKMGFISGVNRPKTLMFLFDSSGEYSIGLLPMDDTHPDWNGLAGELVLKQHPNSGG